ncbi:MAG TPA: PIN domain-containing protein [Candidatus Methylomirabilis sp.]|nr:PIN domain-containing protein [Candidatus Methylomirabilis sp.]
MPATNLAILDTSVYIENFRTGRFTLTLLRLPWVVRCSAVVLHELRRGARTPLELRFVGELARKVRTFTPTESHWLESAAVLSRMRQTRGYIAGKLRDLAFDTLIALSARDAGATLVSCNREDFVEIGKHVAFRAVYW